MSEHEAKQLFLTLSPGDRERVINELEQRYSDEPGE